MCKYGKILILYHKELWNDNHTYVYLCTYVCECEFFCVCVLMQHYMHNMKYILAKRCYIMSRYLHGYYSLGSLSPCCACKISVSHYLNLILTYCQFYYYIYCLVRPHHVVNDVTNIFDFFLSNIASNTKTIKSWWRKQWNHISFSRISMFVCLPNVL